MENNAKTFKPKKGFFILIGLVTILFLGFGKFCIDSAIEFHETLFYILASIPFILSSIMIFFLFQVSNVFTIREEGFEFKKVLYPWRRVFLGGIRKEIIDHTFMFVSVAQTNSEHFFVHLVSENNPKAKIKKIKILNKAYSEYHEIKSLIKKYTKDLHK